MHVSKTRPHFPGIPGIQGLLKSWHTVELDMYDDFRSGHLLINIQPSMDSLHVMKAADHFSTSHFSEERVPQHVEKRNVGWQWGRRDPRYYYEGEMIAKVYGKRFVYRFVLDLKNVVGYSAEELKRQVEECHTREGFSPEFSLPLVAV
ncbi:hypothetical protein SK128_019862 [Halocaridina rubra]|uniref:ETS domain-containing protein n=1 Tax=Halocaridina rubra TaxID=373956 RepID=A0AAN8ZT61_HALRR